MTANSATPERRRLLGAYYTPEPIADILTRWALAPGAGTVLDPSFGGCAFLDAAIAVLAGKGVLNPNRLVFGVDVDPSCMEHVCTNEKLLDENCVVRDFFELTPSDLLGAPFRAVVGNPPYVRHHWFKGPSRQAAKAAMADAGVSVPETASAWAYFLVHAMSFLAEGGRLTMLVPEALLQADYAAAVRDALAARFGRVCLIHVRDRLFDGTDEPVVVVAASEFGQPGSTCIDAVERAEELGQTLNRTAGVPSVFPATTANGRRVDSVTVQLLDELEQHESIRRFADIAIVRIGLVTGANNYFIRNCEDLKRLGVPRKAWQRVVPRTRWLTGLDFTSEDHQKFARADQPAFLVQPEPACEQDSGVRQWIAEGIAAGVHERFKCSRRVPWFRMEIPPAPDAFATCTRMGSPLLVLNRAGYRCTNALHAVRWRQGTEAAPKAVCVGFLTSAVGAWAELHGRRYGGGVMKMEPGTLNRAPVPVAESGEDAFDGLDELMRGEREDEARRLADDIVLRDGMGLSKKDIRRLQQARSGLTSQRRPARSGGAGG